MHTSSCTTHFSVTLRVPNVVERKIKEQLLAGYSEVVDNTEILAVRGIRICVARILHQRSKVQEGIEDLVVTLTRVHGAPQGAGGGVGGAGHEVPHVDGDGDRVGSRDDVAGGDEAVDHHLHDASKEDHHQGNEDLAEVGPNGT